MMNLSADKTILVDGMLSIREGADVNKKRWAIAGGGFITFGIVSMLLGLVLAVESYVGLVIDPDTVVNVSAILLIASFPLLFLGAHSMDNAAAVKSSEREMRTKQFG